MQTFRVVPHVSIGPARLRMSREEIRTTLGQPTAVRDAYEKWGISFPDKDSFFDNAFQVSYDSLMHAEFIEVASHLTYAVTFDGLSVYGAAPNELIDAIRRYAEPDQSDSEYPLCLTFPSLDLSLYRRLSEHDQFEAVGIGTRGYFRGPQDA